MNIAGLEIVYARITYLAYAPKIASAMIKRQQATIVSNLLVVLCGNHDAQPE